MTAANQSRNDRAHVLNTRYATGLCFGDAVIAASHDAESVLAMYEATAERINNELDKTGIMSIDRALEIAHVEALRADVRQALEAGEPSVTLVLASGDAFVEFLAAMTADGWAVEQSRDDDGGRMTVFPPTSSAA